MVLFRDLCHPWAQRWSIKINWFSNFDKLIFLITIIKYSKLQILLYHTKRTEFVVVEPIQNKLGYRIVYFDWLVSFFKRRCKWKTLVQFSGDACVNLSTLSKIAACQSWLTLICQHFGQWWHGDLEIALFFFNKYL